MGQCCSSSAPNDNEFSVKEIADCEVEHIAAENEVTSCDHQQVPLEKELVPETTKEFSQIDQLNDNHQRGVPSSALRDESSTTKAPAIENKTPRQNDEENAQANVREPEEFEIKFDDDEIVVLEDDAEIPSFEPDDEHAINTHGPATGSAEASRPHSPINAKWFEDRGVTPPTVHWHQDSVHIFVTISPANAESGWNFDGNIIEYNCEVGDRRIRVELPLLEAVEDPHFTLVAEKMELCFLGKKTEDDEGHTQHWTQLIKGSRKDYLSLSWIVCARFERFPFLNERLIFST